MRSWARHAAYWQPYIDSGQMVVFGPVLDDTGSWGLGVIEADDEDELRAFAARDPAVISGTADMEIGKMLAGFVRPRDLPPPSLSEVAVLERGWLVDQPEFLHLGGHAVVRSSLSRLAMAGCMLAIMRCTADRMSGSDMCWATLCRFSREPSSQAVTAVGYGFGGHRPAGSSRRSQHRSSGCRNRHSADLVDPVGAQHPRVDTVEGRRLVESHEGVRVVPMAARPVPTIHHHDFSIGLVDQ